MDKNAKRESEEAIEEGEVVSESGTIPDDQAQILLSLEEMIKSNIASSDKLVEEKQKLTESLTDALQNDAQYKQASDTVKEATKTRSVIRSQIMGKAGIIEMATKAKALAAEIKEKKQSLSDYLLEYQRMATNVNEIQGYDGEIREIVHQAKLVKKSKV